MAKEKLRPFLVNGACTTTKQGDGVTLCIDETISMPRLAKSADRAIRAHALWLTRTFFMSDCTSFTIKLCTAVEMPQEILDDLLNNSRPIEEILKEIDS